MTAKAFTLAKLIIDSVWAFATGWKLPGFNFNFATLILGSIIVSLALVGVGDFLVHFGVKPFETSWTIGEDDKDTFGTSQYMSREKYFAGSDAWYRDELKGYYDRRG